MDLEALKDIATKLKAGQMCFGTARDLLQYVGFRRRGIWVNNRIRNELDKLKIITFPPFETTWIDEDFTYSFKGKTKPKNKKDVPEMKSELDDPTFRVGQLESANKEPVSVASNANLEEAVTLMLMNDFSQLPIIEGLNLRGIISWKTIASRLALKNYNDQVSHFMEKAYEITSDESLFKAIELVKQHDAVFVRNKGKISGVITTYDLSSQFKQLAEPFLLLAEIENQIRRILKERLTLEFLQKAKDPDDTEREINCVFDLNFGEYVRLFQNPESWDATKLNIDKKEFTARLDLIRKIRNDVMHFGPDPLENEDLEMLRGFSVFLQTLEKICPS